jgi:hypothetical protein
MFPWFNFWAPQFRFPFSGAVNQDIEPVTDFFSGIAPHAGDAGIERKVVQDVASYGTQLGMLADLLLEVAERQGLKDSKPLSRLQDLQRQVGQVKAEQAEALRKAAEQALERLRDVDRDGLKDVLKRFST